MSQHIHTIRVSCDHDGVGRPQTIGHLTQFADDPDEIWWDVNIPVSRQRTAILRKVEADISDSPAFAAEYRERLAAANIPEPPQIRDAWFAYVDEDGAVYGHYRPDAHRRYRLRCEPPHGCGIDVEFRLDRIETWFNELATRREGVLTLGRLAARLASSKFE